MAAFARYGATILIPHGDGEHYDFIADFGNKMVRVQCKCWENARQSGCIGIPMCSCRMNGSGNIKRIYTSDDADFFSTIWNDKCYLFPVCGNQVKIVRVFESLNGKSNCRSWISEYGIEKVLREYGVQISDVRKSYIDATQKTLSVVCSVCGKEFERSVDSKIRTCGLCSVKSRQSKYRPIIEILKQDYEDMSITKMAEKYHVSQKSVTRWLIKEGIHKPDRFNNRMNIICVKCDLDGNEVCRFKSISEAERSMNCLKSESIHHVLQKGKHCFGGYLWYTKSQFDAVSTGKLS